MEGKMWVSSVSSDLDRAHEKICRLRLLLAKALGIAEAQVQFIGAGKSPSMEKFISDAQKELGLI